MRKYFTVTAILLALVIFAASASAGPPIKNFGGCSGSWSVMFFTIDQTFVPTFSVVKKARIPLANPSEPDALLRVHIYDSGGTLVATSGIAVLSADTVGGGDLADALPFTFGGGVGVTPGAPYRLRIEHVAGGNASMCAIGNNPYTHGALFVDGQEISYYDLAFGLVGGGPPK